jgi:hypothetical protein
VVMELVCWVWPPWRRAWRRGELQRQVFGPSLLALVVGVVGSRCSSVWVTAEGVDGVLRAGPLEGGRGGTTLH